jgi:hypothetical protein
VLPPALASATYDAANQIVSWNGTAFTYDPNGSLVNDGQNTYTWNPRGQLAGIAGPVNASFAYDASGRRFAKTVGANALSFAYDGGGISQELTGGSVTANIWSGGSNAFVQRTDASGTVVPLTDALGSVLALADASGNLLTSILTILSARPWLQGRRAAILSSTSVGKTTWPGSTTCTHATTRRL